jgi:hypothetical protein
MGRESLHGAQYIAHDLGVSSSRAIRRVRLSGSRRPSDVGGVQPKWCGRSLSDGRGSM